MSETRNNHYVPQWHQESFFEPDCNELAYLDLSPEQTFAAYPALMRDTFKYLSKLGDRGAKPNYEKHLAARFAQTHARVQSAIKKAHIPVEQARMLCAFPLGGVQDNTVNRLLLMSNSERHLPSVPMAFFIKGQAPRDIG